MAYEYDDEEGYEMQDDGTIAKSPFPNKQQIQIHRTGSIDISAMNNNIDTPTSINTAPPKAPYTNTNDSMTAQLGAKIRRQAGDLQQLQAALDQANAYSRLCEQRISDLAPNHPFPITQESLGVASPQSSSSSKHSLVRNGGTGAVAKLRREKTELLTTNTQLEKQVRAARTKVTTTTNNLKEMRQQATKKDHELDFQRKKMDKMSNRIVHLENDLRSAVSNANNNGPPSPVPLLNENEKQELNNTINGLENDIVALRQSLQSEARTSEEQRVYIAVLESSVQAKAGEMGFDKGSAELLTKLARLQGELGAREREREQSEFALKAFETEMDDLRKREEMQLQQSNEQESKIHQLSDRLTQFGRGEDDLLNAVKTLESEKTALLDYVEDNAARVAELSHQVQQLEANKLDQEKMKMETERRHRQTVSEANANQELMKIKMLESQAAYESATRDSDDLRTKFSKLQEKSIDQTEELSIQKDENSELREVQNELLETIREKTSAVSTSTRELAMLRRERGSNEGEINTLKSKYEMLQIRMDAQKDLLRSDQKNACDALELQLRDAILAMEHSKTECRETKDRLNQTATELSRSMEHCNELEDIRDELMAERDSQSTHLNDLSNNQEKTERTLEEAMVRLEETEEELSMLRSIRQACDRLSNDMSRMTSMEDQDMQDMQDMQHNEDDDDNDDRFNNSISSWSPNHRNTSELADKLADTRATTLATWCRTDAVHRQLRLASLHGLALGLSNLGSRYLTSIEKRNNLNNEKNVITRTLQDEIHGLRSHNIKIQNQCDAALSNCNDAKIQSQNLTLNLETTSSELKKMKQDVETLVLEKESLTSSLDETEHALSSCQTELLNTKESLEQLENQHNALNVQHDNEKVECERLKEHSADLEQRVEVLGRTSDALRLDLDTARDDLISMQNEHRSDRKLFNEKIRTAEQFAEQAQRSNDDAVRQKGLLEREMDSTKQKLMEETDGKERYSSVTRELRETVTVLEEETRRLSRELSNERNRRETESDSSIAEKNSLERRLQNAEDTRTTTQTSVVSLTTEMESVRRTMVRAVDDVCTKYSHQVQPVSDFLRSRGTRNSSMSPSSKALHDSALAASNTAPLVEGVRLAVREMSTLLNAIAATCVTQQRHEQHELRQSNTRTVSAESELRRAQELLTDARRQHEGTLRDTQVDLASEREKSRQLDHLVRQLRTDNARSGQSNNEMSKKIAALESDLISHQTECVTLRTRLVQCQNDNKECKEECNALKMKLRQEEERCIILQTNLQLSKEEMESLETTVSNELTTLARQHTQQVELCREYQSKLEKSDLSYRECTRSLDNEREESESTRREMLRNQEEHRIRFDEQAIASEIEISNLQKRMDSLMTQSETDRSRHESLMEAVRTELGTAEATVGMLREQNEQLMEERREATSEAARASEALAGQETLSRAEHSQNEALQHRVHSLENELQRVRRLATERSVVASNRSMEISELRGNLSRVEHAIHSPPKEPVQSTPGPVGSTHQRVHINRTGSVSFNAGSAFRQRSATNERIPIRATPSSSSLLASTLSSSSRMGSSTLSSLSSTKEVGPVQVHVSRRGSIDIASMNQSTSTPMPSTTAMHSSRGPGPSPAAQRVRDRLANVRAQFANLRN